MKFLKHAFFIVAFVLVISQIFPAQRNKALTAVNRWVDFSFCERAIKYRVGSIDPKFDTTKEEFSKAISQAASIWNTEYGKPLFIQDDKGELEINLVYDGRQKIVSEINALDGNVTAEKQKVDAENKTFEQKRQELDEKIDALNKEIDYWNSKGGAPEKEYEKLIKTQKEIQKQIEELNTAAAKINKEVEKINSQVHDLNTNVGLFNTILKVNPEVGVYTSVVNKIDIFFYGSHEELVHVLAHEMGHALGLAHVGQPDAIMNPTASSNIVLTDFDKDELNNVCTNKNRWDLIKNDIGNWLYTTLSKFQK
jgi:predicted  nucleic acid-binding Zn-ribbon protein